MPAEVTIATYNAKNFFDSPDPKAAKPAREVRALAGVIDRAAPDILGLQEIESEASLDKLNERLKDSFPYYLVLPGNSDRGINVAFMSRFEFWMTSNKDLRLTDESGARMREYRSERDHLSGRLSPLRFQRDWVLGEFSLPGGKTLSVFNGHLKSRGVREWSRHEPEAVRAAEARGAAAIVQAHQDAHPRRPIVVLGDFNDREGEPAIDPLLRGLRYHDPIHDEMVAMGQKVTTYNAKARERIDYVLLSGVANAGYVPGSATVHKGARAKRASDHYAVSVTLRI